MNDYSFINAMTFLKGGDDFEERQTKVSTDY